MFAIGSISTYTKYTFAQSTGLKYLRRSYFRYDDMFMGCNVADLLNINTL